ncbi:MAG: tryptophan 2,3-dioxygenase family protein, partial [Thermoanaerobaculia bacterium]
HQVYELWFKQVLHELDHLAEIFDGSADHPKTESRIFATLRRVLTILKTMVAQIDILETMNPISFGSFRSRLEAASGFQSPQFRELEFLLGLRRKDMLSHHLENPSAHRRLLWRLQQPTLYQHFLSYLERTGHEIPAGVLEPYEDGDPPSSETVRRTLIGIYRGDDRLTQMCERLVDFDEGLQEWRYRHVKMVERTIGGKPGTGKSAGVAFLRKTLFQPVFPDLWAIRTEL